MEHIETDVAIIAAGLSGLAAAISSAECGASVCVCEKWQVTGGAGNMGMGPLAIDTPQQRRQLYNIEVDKAFDMFMEYTHWRVDAQLVRKYFDLSADTISWLMDMGVRFRVAKYFPQSEATWHQVIDDNGDSTSGSSATTVRLMTQRAVELGVNIHLETPVQSILVDEGHVRGFIAQKSNGDLLEVRSKAVIIATGGFGDNVELIEKKLGYKWGDDFFGIRVPGLAGDGIRMAIEAGAAESEVNIEMIARMASLATGQLAYPEINAVFCQPNLLVNLQGERFFNEEMFSNATFAGNAISLQKGRVAFMVLDEAIKKRYMRNGLDLVRQLFQDMEFSDFDKHFASELEMGNGDLFMADTLEALAGSMGVEIAGFVATVEEYNSMCKSRDEKLCKRSSFMNQIKRAPFYAARFFPSCYGTLGGIKVNHRLEVLTPEHEPIPGLYASGTDACSIFGDSYMFLLPGNTMGFALNSGRMAGENAESYARRLLD